MSILQEMKGPTFAAFLALMVVGVGTALEGHGSGDLWDHTTRELLGKSNDRSTDSPDGTLVVTFGPEANAANWTLLHEPRPESGDGNLAVELHDEELGTRNVTLVGSTPRLAYSMHEDSYERSEDRFHFYHQPESLTVLLLFGGECEGTFVVSDGTGSEVQVVATNGVQTGLRPGWSGHLRTAADCPFDHVSMSYVVP